MKKFFTLIACALVAGSALAQGTVVNAKFSSKSNENADEMAPFKSTEWIDGVQVAVVQSRVVVDPTTGYTEGDEDIPRSTNRCIEVISRDAPVNEETGEVEGIQDWDTQFFIQVPEPWKAGTEYTVKFRYRAEKPASASTQAHALPSKYNDHGILGDISFTTEWQDFEKTGTLTAAQAVGNGGQFQSIAFNLAAFKNANKYYFDDISITVNKVPKEEVWKEIFASDGTDAAPFSVKYFKNYTTPKSEDGAIVVTSLEPDKTYAEYYMEDNDGNAVDAVLANNWDTQFLIPLGTNLVSGKTFKITFKYKADKAAGSESQVHMAPPAAGAIESKGFGEYPEYAGTYIHYQLLNPNLSFTEEWQTYNEDLSTVISVPTQATEEKPMGAVCLNLSVLRESINYYFDDIKVYVDEDDIPTGISAFKAEKSSKAIYNVAGQQIKALQKGLNIVNGEKVYVK
ncbi:MAG: hypothetical protein IKH43_02135 [Bacteroidaceae bacterium]|nr:hypothetical protein [Bacteroidaceae bacterium]